MPQNKEEAREPTDQELIAFLRNQLKLERAAISLLITHGIITQEQAQTAREIGKSYLDLWEKRKRSVTKRAWQGPKNQRQPP